MSDFDSLTWAFEDWFDSPLRDLPDAVRQRVEQEFFPMPWDELSAEQRRSVALQLDYQHDPATEQDQSFWWDFFEQVNRLKNQVAEWELVATPTAAELALKESRLAELKLEIARMDAQQRLARGDYFPERKLPKGRNGVTIPEIALAIRYVAYPKAMNQLALRLGATPEELAAWVWFGPKDGGIAAYMNANELDPPPRFFYVTGNYNQDYIAPLMACWFKVDEIDHFEPTERYMLGATLIERWGKQPGLHAVAFIQAKIAESRLADFHPIFGGTRGSFAERPDWPPLESGLFPMAHIEQIEAEDFAKSHQPDTVTQPEGVNLADHVAPPKEIPLGSPEWRKQTAQAAANARHDLPGGSRDKQRQIRDIWASGKYTSRAICAEEECAALGMSHATAIRALSNTPEPSRC